MATIRSSDGFIRCQECSAKIANLALLGGYIIFCGNCSAVSVVGRVFIDDAGLLVADIILLDAVARAALQAESLKLFGEN